MQYTQYRDASLKHLNACKTALHGLKFYHGSAPLSRRKKESLLLNIFYLSGYTLECIINYSIYKRLGFSTNSRVENLQDTSRSIAFYKKPNGSTHQFQYCIQQHKFHLNVQLLHTLLPGGHGVPLIDRTVYVLPNLQKMVFDRYNGTVNNEHWKPEIRYKTTIPFSQTDIEQFVELTEKIYIELLTIA